MAVLTLSWEHQNGCREIGKAVAQQLNYEYVDRHVINSVLKAEDEKWGNLAIEMDEEPPSLWEQFDRQYHGFIALIESAIYDVALRNNAVILGRGGAFILHDIQRILKVRLYSPLKIRIERRMNLLQEEYGSAEAFIEKTDASRAAYIQALYGKKLTSVTNYDLIYNTSIQSYDQVINNLVEILRDWNRRETPENRKKLESQAITAKVKAKLLTRPGLFIPTLKVFFNGRDIVLQGVLHNAEELKLIQDIIKETAGAHSIRNELKYRG